MFGRLLEQIRKEMDSRKEQPSAQYPSTKDSDSEEFSSLDLVNQKSLPPAKEQRTPKKKRSRNSLLSSGTSPRRSKTTLGETSRSHQLAGTGVHSWDNSSLPLPTFSSAKTIWGGFFFCFFFLWNTTCYGSLCSFSCQTFLHCKLSYFFFFLLDQTTW